MCSGLWWSWQWWHLTATKRCSACGETKAVSEFHKCKGHSDGRHSYCKECVKAKHKKWREDNHARAVEASCEWQRQNKEKHNEHGIAYRKTKKGRDAAARALEKQKTPEGHAKRRAWKRTPRGKAARRRWEQSEKARAYQRAYRQAYAQTPEGKASAARRNAKRRQRVSAAPATLTAVEWQDLLDEQNHACAYCGRPFSVESKPTRDHIVPVSRGGGLTKENIVPACLVCNSVKGTSDLADG